MPDQPTISARVAPAVQPGASLPMAATPDAFGAGIGEAIDNIGDVATSIHQKALAEANQTAVLDADNQTNGFLNQRLYDPKTGILHQNLGKDAPAAVDEALAAYDQHVAQVAGRLTNDRQRLAYERMTVARRFEMQRTLGGYEHAEVTRHADEVDKAAIAGATTAAIQSAGDPEAVYQSIDRQKAVIADAGARKGLAPELVTAQQNEAASATHLGVLEQLLSTGQDPAAKVWYDAHKGDLNAHDATAAAKMVEAGTTAGESQRIADAIVRGPDNAVLPRDQVLDRIQADTRLQADPKLRAAVETRAEHFLGQHQEAVAEADKASFQQAFAVAKGSQQGIYDPKVVTLMATMTPERQEMLKSYFAKDGEIHSNPVQVNALRLLAATDPGEFVKVVRNQGPELMTKLAPADFAKVLADEQEIRTKGTLGDAPGIEAKSRVMDDALLAAGFGITGKTGTVTINRNAPGAVALVGQIDARVKAQERATGKAMLPDDVRKVADEVTIETVVQPRGSWYGYAKPQMVFTLTPEQRDLATRDLSAYEKTNPTEAGQIRSNLVAATAKLGIDATRLKPDHYNRAFAQFLIVRDLAAAGDRAGAQRATDRLAAILNEARQPVAKPANPGLGSFVPPSTPSADDLSRMGE